MTERGDIVARLRDYQATVPAAPPYYQELMRVAADEIEHLRMDRDSLRRRVCREAFRRGPIYRAVGRETVQCQTPQEIAEALGWRCFEGGAQ